MEVEQVQALDVALLLASPVGGKAAPNALMLLVAISPVAGEAALDATMQPIAASQKQAPVAQTPAALPLLRARPPVAWVLMAVAVAEAVE
jgi:hypothetical protein